MKLIQIKNRITGSIMFEGQFSNKKQAIEAAISQKKSLAGADLGNLNLNHANLDGANLQNASLENTSLFGTNLSEADLSGANLRNTDLTAACLCESRLHNTDFTGALFGATLVSGAIIGGCIFSTPSALALPLQTAHLGTNTYLHEGTAIGFDTCPLVISGLPEKMILLGPATIIGSHLYHRAGTGKNIRKTIEKLAAQATG